MRTAGIETNGDGYQYEETLDAPEYQLASMSSNDNDSLFVEQDNEDHDTLFVSNDGAEHVFSGRDAQAAAAAAIAANDEGLDAESSPPLPPMPERSSLLGKTVPAQRSAFVEQAVRVRLNADLKYQRKIVQELLEQDALLVLGKGLGMSTVVANVLHAMDVAGTRRDPDNRDRQTGKESLVMLIGADAEENASIAEELWFLGNNEESPHRGMEVITTEAVTITKRAQLYSRGGIFSVTSRILIGDMLAELADPASITGIVVLHADRVSSSSPEAFILNVYRENNRAGFIKALTDRPEAISFGFSPLQERMKTLQLRKALLWPRFRYEIKEALEHDKRNKEVIEIRVDMTTMMAEVQSSLRELIQATISDIKAGVSKVVETEEWTLDESIERPDFARYLSIRLDAHWHQLSSRTRQAVANLTSLRGFLDDLTTLDAVTFYREIEEYYDSQGPDANSLREPAPWLFHDAANALFVAAKSRVYGDKKEKADNHHIEELPKWEHLAHVLDEISAERASGVSTDGPIVISCRTRKTARQIRDYLRTMRREREHSGAVSYSGQKYMRNLLRDYKAFKEFLRVRKVNRHDSAHDIKMRSLGTGESVPPPPVTGAERSGENGGAHSRFGGRPSNKRRRVRGGSIVAAASAAFPHAISAAPDAEEKDIVDLTAKLEDDEVEIIDDNDETGLFVLNLEQDGGEDGGGSLRHKARLMDRSSLVFIHPYDSQRYENVLRELMPSYVVMYEPDVSFIREVEVYRATHADSLFCKVYTLYYGESVEEQQLLAEIRKEKDAFSKLVREKASMPLFLDTDEDRAPRDGSDVLRTVTTRIAGGGMRAIDEAPRVVVDIREFRSPLALEMYRIGIQIIPVTLTVGDYIISPRICIERKSVRDLIASFRSGRLYTQCVNMARYYEKPTLLIEFDGSKAFTLEAFTNIRTDAKSKTRQSKQHEEINQNLSLLLLHFPKLQIIWASSPQQSAQIIRELKMSDLEPDPVLSSSFGLEGGEDINRSFNDAAIDLLQAIPGITAQNYYLVTRRIPSIAALVACPEDKLAEILESREAARQVVRFFESKLD